MNFPKISVITPSYNQGQFIEQTIQSVISQNYPNLEYIIIDGGSTDGSVEIIKKYSHYLKYWVSEPDKGQSDAINKGLKIVSGEIINWLNSDDYYYPNALFKVADAFANEEIHVVCARARLFGPSIKAEIYSKGTDVFFHNLPKTIGWARIDQPETFFRSIVFSTLGNLNTDLNYLMDRDFWIRYLLKFGLGHIRKVDDVLVNFRIHSQSKTFSESKFFQTEHDSWFYAFSMKNSMQKYGQVIKKHFEINETFQLDSVQPVPAELAEKILNYYLLQRANEFYAQNRKNDFISLAQFIDPAFLTSNDVSLMNTLVFRNKFIPASLLKIVRSLKEK